MKINPLLSNEISVSDQIDEAHNEKYSKELKVLYDEIMEDLKKADKTGTGRVLEEELLDFLQKKLPPQRQLNIPLFKRFLQNVDQNMESNIDLNEFCKKYIQAHEELKLNFETLKKGFDKEKNLKNGLQEKIQEVKQEQMNKNGISQNAVVQTEIGKITFLSQINTDQIYCTVNLDDNDQTIGVFKPRIIVVTSYFDWYQKQYDNIDKNIESYQAKINELSETLEELSLPYKAEFEKSQLRLKQGGNIGINNDQLVNGVEGILKHAFKDRKVKWMVTLKIILYFCILTLLFTTLVKPDFISLVICLLLLILLNTCRTNYIFENINIFLGGIIIMIVYDLIDYVFLRKFSIEIMSRVEGWARFFGFLGFLGKIALFCAVFVVKIKYQKTGFILE